MTYYSTKTYEHLGSSAFRQWRADSHCKFLHGYSFTIRIVFGSEELDIRNWVVDFGSLKSFKQRLEDTLDHKVLVAKDDPQLEWYREGHRLGVLDLVEVEHTGCERFAELIYEVLGSWLLDNGYSPRCWIESVEISEHGANSAIYRASKQGCPCGCSSSPIVKEDTHKPCDWCSSFDFSCTGLCGNHEQDQGC